MKFIKQLYFPIVAIAMSLFLGGIILVCLGFNPIYAYINLFSGAFGNTNAIVETISKSIPVIFTGLSFAIAKKCGLINLGAEGQFYIGGLCATIVGTMENIPCHILMCLLAGIFGGAIYGMLVGVLKVKFGASELITTIMFNYIAIQFISYCVNGPMQATSAIPQSAKVLPSAMLVKIFDSLKLHYGLVVVIIAIIVYHVIMSKTISGYEMKVVGNNQTAAKYAGIDVGKNTVKAMCLSGGFAGLGGAVELLAVQFIMRTTFSANYGFDGIAVALLGQNSPIGIALSGMMFGMLRSGSNKMQMLSGVPSATIYMIQGLIILFVVSRELLVKRRGK